MYLIRVGCVVCELGEYGHGVDVGGVCCVVL